MTDFSVGHNLGRIAVALERLGTNVLKAAKLQAMVTLVQAGYSPRDAADEVRLEQ
jgi:hypothetical protein